MSNKISFTELSLLVNQLSLQELRKLNTAYIKNNKVKNKIIDKRILSLTTENVQSKLLELGLCKECPKCGEKKIVRYGTKNNIQRFRCTDCGAIFNVFTNTFMSKTHFTFDMWIEMVYMLLNHRTLKEIKKDFEENYDCLSIDIKTIFAWRQKLLDASKGIPFPLLKGTVQVDETYFFNNQKGSRKLINPLNTKESREPRKRAEVSKLGCMSPEFANVVCAVDESDHVIAKVISMGVMSEEAFNNEILPYITNTTWLCTDANRIYNRIANTLGAEHYVRPSGYVHIIEKIRKENLDYRKVYDAGELDYIERLGKYVPGYNEMVRLKKQHNLSLSKVNSFHSVLTRNVETFTKGVSTNHLDSYVAWEVMIYNYRIDNHIKDTFSRKDAENILIMLLKTHRKLTANDISNCNISFDFDRRYLNRLEKKTNSIRQLENGYGYKATSEDITDSFNKREFLSQLKASQLKEIAKDVKLKKYSSIRKGHTWFAIKALEVHPDIDNAINRYLLNHSDKRNPEKFK